MQYQLEAMREAGIREVAVVVGPGGEPIRRAFGDGGRLGLRLAYVEDPAPAGIAASLARAEPWVRGPFALFLGDIFLALDALAPALAPLGAGAAGTVVVRRDAPAAVRRNFAVLTAPDGRITRVLEKPAVPPTDLKGCGVYVFAPAIFEAIRRTPRSPLRGEYELTDALQGLIDTGAPVYAAHVVRWDVNITYPQDLLDTNLRLLRERRLDSLIGDGAQVNMAARLIDSVVGDRAAVLHPVTLEECLVLPDGHVPDLAELSSATGTPPTSRAQPHQPGTVSRYIFGDGLVWAASAP
jgi:glucose-1-phosphate thymidylyltransferase